MEHFTVTHKNGKTLRSVKVPLLMAIRLANKVREKKLVAIQTDGGLFHIAGEDIKKIMVDDGSGLPYDVTVACMQEEPHTEYFSDYGDVFRLNGDDQHEQFIMAERRIGDQWIPAVLPEDETFTRLSKVLYEAD